jgi:pimeloyl-ACP methyl ester carboxylesterase
MFLMCAAGFAAAVLVAALLYQFIGAARDARRFPPPGRLVPMDGAGGARLHLHGVGDSGPVVILDAGIGASSLSWRIVQAQAARFARVYAYDRAGFGWSDPPRRAQGPRVASRLAEELRAALHAARITGPYILVGHSFGGMLVRAYAAKHPKQVAGLVLVDPLSAGEWLNISTAHARMLRLGVKLARRGALLARIGVVRVSLALLMSGGRRIPKWIAKLSSGRGESVISRLVGEVGKMPPETWPMVRAHWCLPKSFLGLAAYLESLPASAAEADALVESDNLPVIVLSAANSTPEQLKERAALAHRSSHGRHIVATKSGHWIQLDEPELVVQAVREMAELVRPS